MLPGASRYIHFFVRVIDHPARANRHGIFSPGSYLPLTIRKIFRAKNIGSSNLQVFVNRPRPEGESPYLLIEVKMGSGGNQGRAARQKVVMKQIAEYLSNDTREVEGYLCQRVSVTQFPEYPGDTFTKLATALPRGGRIIEEVERGLYYILLDACKTHNYDEVFGPLLDKHGPMMLLRVNDMQRQYCGYSPFPLDVLFVFIMVSLSPTCS